MKPSDYLKLSFEEKAFIIACIDIKMENEKKANKKASSKKGRK